MGELYNWIAFGHIIGAAIWFGGTVTYEILGGGAKRTGGSSGYVKFIHSHGRPIGLMLSVGAVLTLVFGILLVPQSDSAWSFGDTFITVGFLAAIIGIISGGAIIAPMEKKLTALVDANGFDAPEAATIAGKMATLEHIQIVILSIAMIAMIFKF